MAGVDSGAGVHDGNINGVLNAIADHVDVGAAAVVLVFLHLFWLEANVGVGEGTKEGLVEEVSDEVVALGANSSIEVAGGIVGGVLDEVNRTVAWTDEAGATMRMFEWA
jgi:hypothetical protein